MKDITNFQRGAQALRKANDSNSMKISSHADAITSLRHHEDAYKSHTKSHSHTAGNALQINMDIIQQISLILHRWKSIMTGRSSLERVASRTVEYWCIQRLRNTDKTIQVM